MPTYSSLALLALRAAAQSESELRPSVPVIGATLRVAVIGDYGASTPGEQSVANLVAAYAPDLVITLGDNNYPAGDAATIDDNIGRYYSRWIWPYTGTYARGPRVNRFFPALGNHDWIAPNAQPYLDYFTLPGNERYYDFRAGPVHFFALDSDANEPDGITQNSAQAQWLQSALAAATEPFKVVYFHHAPFSSADHGNNYELQWPFRAWGADLVLAGHDHSYERFAIDGFPYVVNGLGGAALYTIQPLVTGGSAFRYASTVGVVHLEADAQLLTLRFADVNDVVQDEARLRPSPANRAETVLVAAGATWRYQDDGSNQGTAWRANGFDDTSWPQGAAQFGFGDGDEATAVNGGPANARTATLYFRRTFRVPNPAAFRALRLELLRDDGAAVYLNGTEILRDNLAAGATSSTYAASNAGYDENAWHPYDVPASALIAGSNTLAVELHQANATSSDLGFDLRLTGEHTGTPLVARGAVWKYQDAGNDPGASWFLPSFVDTAWSSGPAELGYGDGDEATVVSFGSNAQAKPITTWFRRTFTVANPSQFTELLLELERDDGVRVYLNGVEALRNNLPRGTVTSATPAGRSLSAPEESSVYATSLDPRLLVVGANTLAVEVHQANPQSSDLSFDLALTGF